MIQNVFIFIFLIITMKKINFGSPASIWRNTIESQIPNLIEKAGLELEGGEEGRDFPKHLLHAKHCVRHQNKEMATGRQSSNIIKSMPVAFNYVSTIPGSASY